MVICFECSQEVKVSLDRLMTHGDYRDYSEAIRTAIQNLAVLQDSVGRNGTPFMHANDTGKSVRPDTSRSGGSGEDAVPLEFCPEGLEESPNVRVRTPDRVVPSQSHLEDWIFGQYNRLLPAKANCRALIRLLASNRLIELLSELFGQAVQGGPAALQIRADVLEGDGWDLGVGEVVGCDG